MVSEEKGVVPFLDCPNNHYGYNYAVFQLTDFFKRYLYAKKNRFKSAHDVAYYDVCFGNLKEQLSKIMLLEDRWLDWCHYGFIMRRFENEKLAVRT